MAFQFVLRSALDGHIITMIRDVVTHAPLSPGQTGQFELTLPDVALRPGEFSIFAYICRVDDVVGYDMADFNVDLPFLTVIQ